MKVFYFDIDYNINYWGSQVTKGHVFAESYEEAEQKLINKFGDPVPYNKNRNARFHSFQLKETDGIILIK